MFLSIIIPVYNDEPYLEECLNSCLNNNLSADEYEIICVDDGSTDKTPEILRQYEKQFPNIRIIFKEHGNGGRTVGYEKAKGDYIWFVDHDDVVAPHAVDELFEVTRQHNIVDRIAFPYYEFYYSLTQEESKAIMDGSLRTVKADTIFSYNVWSSIIKKAFLDSNSINPRSKRINLARKYWSIPLIGVWGGDRIFMEECFDHGITSFQMTGRPLYHYRRNDNSETMKLTKSARDKRKLLQYNAAMVRAYNAMMFREKYLDEREHFGHATEETTVNMIVKIREVVSQLAMQPCNLWKEGMELLDSKDAFFASKPEEYHFSLRAYLKKMGLIRRFNPKYIALYYAYTVRGAKWYRVLSTFDRETVNSVLLTKIYRYIKAHIIRKRTK